jgi:hypothetical protein
MPTSSRAARSGTERRACDSIPFESNGERCPSISGHTRWPHVHSRPSRRCWRRHNELDDRKRDVIAAGYEAAAAQPRSSSTARTPCELATCMPTLHGVPATRWVPQQAVPARVALRAEGASGRLRRAQMRPSTDGQRLARMPALGQLTPFGDAHIHFDHLQASCWVTMPFSTTSPTEPLSTCCAAGIPTVALRSGNYHT